MTVHERAPAKTNLFLEILGKRPDGYHALDTVFVELSLADALRVEPAPEGTLSLTIEGAPELAQEPDNLVLRAARLLRARRGSPELGAEVTLTKHVPIGGGLGGGSSDAAAALRALNHLWELAAAPAELEALAGELGSDVAFFVRGGVQRGTGRGEVLEPIPPCPALPLVLLVPPFGCPTPAVYRALAGSIPERPRRPRDLVSALGHGPEAVAAQVFNRLEGAALSAFPALAPLLADLRAAPGVLAGWVSGSGSTLIGLCATPPEADVAAAALAAQGHAVFRAAAGGA
ncbi:MAG: 4-(cytidine 5'-diphospho)-2-C-methyl-D-erythritol kinase [Planctomycetota bacterium]